MHWLNNSQIVKLILELTHDKVKGKRGCPGDPPRPQWCWFINEKKASRANHIGCCFHAVMIKDTLVQ